LRRRAVSYDLSGERLTERGYPDGRTRRRGQEPAEPPQVRGISAGFSASTTGTPGEAGDFAAAEFARLNREHFAGSIPPMPVIIGLTAFGKCIGATRDGGWLGSEYDRDTCETGHGLILAAA
jgi:hypothetical protein